MPQPFSSFNLKIHNMMLRIFGLRRVHRGGNYIAHNAGGEDVTLLLVIAKRLKRMKVRKCVILSKLEHSD